MIFYYHSNKSYFHKKGFAIGLVLSVKVFGTRKWPIVLFLQNFFYITSTDQNWLKIVLDNNRSTYRSFSSCQNPHPPHKLLNRSKNPSRRPRAAIPHLHVHRMSHHLLSHHHQLHHHSLYTTYPAQQAQFLHLTRSVKINLKMNQVQGYQLQRVQSLPKTKMWRKLSWHQRLGRGSLFSRNYCNTTWRLLRRAGKILQ